MAKTLRLELLSTHNPDAVPLDGQYHLEFIRRRLLADEVYSTKIRYDPTTGAVQSTEDGTTWVADPSADPRLSSGIPKRTDDATNCHAAQSVREYFHRYILLVLGLLGAGAGVVQGVGTILGFLGLLTGGYDVLWGVVTAMFGSLIGYGSGTITSAFTTFEYDALASILYCTMNGGQLDAAGLASVKQQVTARVNATAAAIINLMLDVMGYAGVNRAALLYTIATPCTGFPSCNWSLCVDLTWLWGNSFPSNAVSQACPQTATLIPQGALGAYGGHPAWLFQKTVGDTANRFARRFNIDLSAGSTLTKIEFWMQRSAGNIDNFNKQIWPLGYTPVCYTGAFHNNPQVLNTSIPGAQTLSTIISVGTTIANDASTMAIDQIRITGTGPRPNVLTVAQIYA